MPDGFTPIFKAAGTGHRAGAVPDPGPDTPASYVLRADATWGTGGFIPLPPAPTGPGGDNLACKIAGYLVQEVVRQCFQVALNQITGVGGFQGLIFQVLDLLPFSADIIPWAVDSTVSLIERIVAGGLVSEVEAWLEDRLWNLIGCYVYSIVDPAVGWTEETWQALIDFVLAIPVIPGPVLALVADFLRELGVDAANALAALAANVDYDCSACTGPYSGATGLPTGPTTSGLPLNYDAGLTVSDGGTGYVLKVGQLEFEGATVTGLTGASGGTWGNIAQISGLQGATGPKGDTGAAGPTGPNPVPDTAIVTDTTWKALSLWNGSGNDAPPSGWETAAFDHSGWPNAVQTGVQHPPIVSIWAPSPAAILHQHALFFHSFTVPDQAVWGAEFSQPPGEVSAVYVNGTQVYPGPATVDPPVPLVADRSLIVRGATNSVAFMVDTQAAFPPYVFAQLDLYTSDLPPPPGGATGAAGDTGPAGPAGATGGAGILLLVGALVVTPSLSIDSGTFDSTYNNLEFRLLLRQTSTGGGETVRLRFNGDTGSNYDSYSLDAFASSLQHRETIGGNYGRAGFTGDDLSGVDSHIFTTSIIRVAFNQSTDSWKVWIVDSGWVQKNVSGDVNRAQGSGMWHSTDPISRIQVYCTTDAFLFKAGSRLEVYAW